MSLKKYTLLTSLTLWLIISVVGCQSGTPSSSKKANEDELIDRLSVELISQPRNQAEIDRNMIINYAIDSLLDVRSTPSGLYYFVQEAGEGTTPNVKSKVTAHYRGRLFDGGEFDSSYSRGEPLEFGLHQMIKGWQEAIPMLKPGGKGTFLIPSNLAYGSRGFPGLVPPNTVLRFDIHLIKVN